MEVDKNKYHFFWGGEFSNWHPSEFEVDGMTFNCGEQFMMYHKAMAFNDTESAEQIMNTKDPRTQKKIGRQVKGYNDKIWAGIRYDTVKLGLFEKFIQNEHLLEILLSMKDKIIVEASPYDRIWGIGYGEHDENIFDEMDNWGENLLGEMLMEIRDELIHDLENW